MEQYAIQVPHHSKRGKYILIRDINQDGLPPVLYNTKEEAETRLSFWGPKAKVVEYSTEGA